MRVRPVVVLALALAAGACRKREQVRTDTSEAKDIPRQFAVEELRKLLPTAEEIICTLPKHTYKKADIREWILTDQGLEIRTAKEKPLVLAYSEVTLARLEKAGGGKSFYLKVFTTVQKEKDKEHFQFMWHKEDDAKRGVELFEALRVKQ